MVDAGPEVTTTNPRDGVAVLTVDRPQRRNTFRAETWSALSSALAAAESDTSIGAIVVTGAGGVFSAGGDLRTVPATGSGDSGVDAPAGRLRLASEALRRAHRMRKPTISAVEGYAIGAGFALAMCTTSIVASTSAFFSAAFLERGFVPDCASAWLLPRLVGPARAAEILLSARRVSAEEAHRFGIVGQLAADGSALDDAVALAGRFADGPRDSYALTLGLLRRASALSFEDFLEDEAVSVALSWYGPDAVEGRAAFLERRPSQFPDARRRWRREDGAADEPGTETAPDG